MSGNSIIRVSDDIITELQTEVSRAVAKSVFEETPEHAMGLAIDLAATGYMRGVQLSQLLYELDCVWHKFKTDDRFEDAVDKAIGYDPKTTRKYVRMYRYVLGPHPELIGKPIGALIELTGAAAQGQLTDEHWERIEAAHDKRSIVDIRREAMGEQGRGLTRMIYWFDRAGYLHGKQGSEGVIVDMGFVDKNSDNPVIQAFLILLESVGVGEL